MPGIEIDTIYKIGTFEFRKAYSVKTHEEAISLQKWFANNRNDKSYRN